jgi:hypothetical protein
MKITYMEDQIHQKTYLLFQVTFCVLVIHSNHTWTIFRARVECDMNFQEIPCIASRDTTDKIQCPLSKVPLSSDRLQPKLDYL